MECCSLLVNCGYWSSSPPLRLIRYDLTIATHPLHLRQPWHNILIHKDAETRKHRNGKHNTKGERHCCMQQQETYFTGGKGFSHPNKRGTTSQERDSRMNDIQHRAHPYSSTPYPSHCATGCKLSLVCGNAWVCTRARCWVACKPIIKPFYWDRFEPNCISFWTRRGPTTCIRHWSRQPTAGWVWGQVEQSTLLFYSSVLTTPDMGVARGGSKPLIKWGPQ